jgi:hypothetical protein
MLETGLHYNWHRWYDASLGRYTQPDLLGLEDGPNRYAYAYNSPLMYVDPSGQQGTSAPGMSPIPIPLPAITIPGTPENKAWTDWATGFLKSCFADDDDDEERCREVIKECKRMCNEQFVDSPDMLPGYGSDYFPRIRQCIRMCAEDEGCTY